MSRSRSSKSRYALFALLLRAALVAFALQLGGMIHGAADALVAVGVLCGEHEQCPPDGACDDCMAGCPNCHCSATLRTVAPRSDLSIEPAHAERYRTAHAPDASNVPLGPILPSVYRPPRSVSVAVS